MRTFQQIVEEELVSVRRRCKPFVDLHQGLGILWEEFTEFRDEVFKKSRKRDLANTLRELVQIAGIAQRIAEDLLQDQLNPPAQQDSKPAWDPRFSCIGPDFFKLQRQLEEEQGPVS